MKKSFKKNIVLLLVSIFVLFILSEIILRILGREPYKLELIDTIAKPGGKLFQPDSLLGYKNLPGEFEITIRQKLKFKATHLEVTGNRITHPTTSETLNNYKDEIWIFGGSSSYGWGVNDNETYSWLLQNKFPEYEVVNFSVNGFGPLHALIQFKEALKNKGAVKTVIFAYGSYQDRRSTASRGRRKFFIGPWNKFGNYKQPVAKINTEGKLEYQMEELTYSELPFMRYSALIHTIEKAMIKIENNSLDIHGLSKKIIQEINEIALNNNLKFIVAGIWNDVLTYEMIDYCKSIGINAVDASVDLLLPGNSNRPYDEHPSFKAHKFYAEKISTYLKDSIFISND